MKKNKYTKSEIDGKITVSLFEFLEEKDEIIKRILSGDEGTAMAFILLIKPKRVEDEIGVELLVKKEKISVSERDAEQIVKNIIEKAMEA